MDELSLAGEFPAATREGWRDLVERVLKGADFDRKLVGTSYDSLRIEPLYPKSDRDEPAIRATPGPWRVCQRVDHPDPKAGHALALSDLEGGADALALTFAGAPGARGFGLAGTGNDLDQALDGVMLDLISVRLDAAGRGRKAARALVEIARTRGHDLAALDLDLGMDPIGALAGGERLIAPWPDVEQRLGRVLRELGEQGFAGRAFMADGRPYHDAGGSDAQELAAVLATGIAYLRALEAGGHPIEAARDALGFLLVADADQFLSVAKFRALRRLWARVETACGLEPRPIRLHAETAWRMTTRRDPFVNILRGTMASFSAAIGGADAITILPFTAALGLPDAFARRIARNTQLILLEEANLWRVGDPFAGSGGIEALTDALAAEAWAGLQQIEREGGIVASLLAGALQGRVATVRAKRETAVATRRDPLTGTSEFPNLAEAPVAVLLTLPSTASIVDGAPSPDGTSVPEPLRPMRLAAAFEDLRDASDATLATSGKRPSVFLANLGSPADFVARATFAKNAFEAGGIAAIGEAGFVSPEEAAEAFRASGASLACLCSTDAIYVTQAARVAAGLKAAGAKALYLAGRPGEGEAELRAAGVKDFVYVGCDLLRLLQAAAEAASGD